jgi:hypothetical protein
MVRDLGSTNGTWVNEQQVLPGREVVLTLGDKVLFADAEWTVAEVAEPVPAALLIGGSRECRIREGVIAIPDDTTSIASIFRAADGGWTLEVGDDVRPVRSGETFRIADQAWTFWSPSEWKSTSRRRRIRLVRDSTLLFEVSQDEERVVLTVESQRERIAMGQLSSYYLLLTLARMRQASSREPPPEDSGWVHRDDLARMLRCGEQQLNVWVHRIRSKFSLKGFLDYANIVERRDRTGQMRLGVAQAVIRST